MKTGSVRVAMLAASPMYYQAPLYRRIAADPRVDFTAIFASSGGPRSHDAGYGRPITWDVDVLSGYRSRFLRRADRNPIAGSFLSLRDVDIVSVLARERFEVLWIHGYNFLTMIFAAAAQRLAGGALLFREEQTLLHQRPPAKAIAKEILLRTLYSMGGALAIGTENQRWFMHYGVPRSKTFATPYCVDNEHLQVQARLLAPRKSELRTKLGIASDAPVILTVGRLIAKKQPLLLLEAFRRLRSERPCTLLVVGTGELEQAMRRKVLEEHIPDVVFAGFLNQSEIARAYAAADIFALVSAEHETWGLVVNEAMNFGLPVVISDKVGSGSDLVCQEGNGFIVGRSDLEGLIGRLRALVESPELRRCLGAASINRISGWNYDVAARGVLDAVAWSVGGRRWSLASESSVLEDR